ncbi:MAG: SRPBCC family protein [Rhizobiaceae bacterium]
MALKTILIGGGIALAALSFIPFTFPSSTHVERSALIKAAPAELFQLISSSEGFQTFNPYKTADPDLKITMHGPASGIGSGFAFDGKDGKGTQTISAMEQDRSITMAIDLGFKGQPVQKFELKPSADGTQVTWGMDIKFGMNPIGRIMGLFMDGMVGPTYEQGLKNLALAVANKV